MCSLAGVTVAVELTDEELVARAREGDATAFDALARRHRGWLVRFCTGLLSGDRDLAEDVAQECLVKTFRLLGREQAPDRLRPWLRTVARHACVDECRRTRPEPVAKVPDEAVTAEESDGDPSLATAWDRLASRHRDVLRHRELHGLSYAEIAAAMGLSIAAVETLLFRARAALRREYARAGGSAWPSESLARSLLLVEGGRLADGGVRLGTALAASPATASSSGLAGIAEAAAAGGPAPVEFVRDILAKVAPSVVALGLLAGGATAPQLATPPVPATVAPPTVAVAELPATAPSPDLGPPPVDAPPADPPAASDEPGVPAAPDAPAEEPDDEAEQEAGRYLAPIRERVGASLPPIEAVREILRNDRKLLDR